MPRRVGASDRPASERRWISALSEELAVRDHFVPHRLHLSGVEGLPPEGRRDAEHPRGDVHHADRARSGRRVRSQAVARGKGRRKPQ